MVPPLWSPQGHRNARAGLPASGQENATKGTKPGRCPWEALGLVAETGMDPLTNYPKCSMLRARGAQKREQTEAGQPGGVGGGFLEEAVFDLGSNTCETAQQGCGRWVPVKEPSERRGSVPRRDSIQTIPSQLACPQVPHPYTYASSPSWTHGPVGQLEGPESKISSS